MRAKDSVILVFSLLLLLLFVSVSSVSATPRSVMYNGKEYYVVSSTDPNLNTGARVCAAVGKTCVGYTAFTTDVCKLFHPDATITSGVDGSKAGFYCNGAPQQGICAREQNTCDVCPACNVNADCDFDVSGLFREMYVECSGGAPTSGSTTDSTIPQTPPSNPNCPVYISSKNLNDFLQESGALNYELGKCPTDILGLADLLGNGRTEVAITKRDGSTQSFYVDIKEKKAYGLQLISTYRTYLVELDEESFEYLLQADDRFGTFSTLYKEGKIKISGGTFFTKLKMFFYRPVLGYVLGKHTIKLTPLIPPGPGIKPASGYWECEFSQAKKKLVTCAAYKAADNFCVIALTSPYARAVECEDNGLIVCANPCKASMKQVIPARCPYDAERTRGNQAPPLNSCS